MRKIGIIGAAGNMGFKRIQALIHLNGMQFCREKLVLCDIHPNKIYDVFSNGNVTINQSSIIDDDDISHVIISTPNSNERDEMVLTSLAQKKHVLVEKPQSFSYQTIKSMFKLAEQNNVCLKVAYNLDFYPGYQLLKNRAKDLGDIFLFNAFYGNGWFNPDNPPQSWILDKESVGGIEYYMGCHMLSLLWGLAREREISDKRIIKSDLLYQGKADTSTISLKFGGIVCNVIVSWRVWQNKFELNVLGSDGMATINSMVKYIKYGQEGERLTFAFRQKGMPVVEEKLYTYDNVDQFSADYEFLDIEMADWFHSIESSSYDNGVECAKNLFIHSALSS